MGKNQMVRLLNADEIECRVSAVNAKGVSLLLYKDARVDQKILDETFGIFGWKRSHQCINGSLYCTVEVYDKEGGCWVSKQDVGAAGYAEKEKSVASDSFKRACFNWGIGRELYTAPFIWIPASDVKIGQKDGRFYCKEHFCISSIAYNKEREISSLKVAVCPNGKIVYEFNGKGSGNGFQQPVKAETGVNNQQLHTFEAELQRTGVSMDAVKGRYGFDKPQDMSAELYNRVMNALAKTKSAGDVA